MERAAGPPALTFADATKIVELRTKIVSTSSVLIGTAWAYFGAGAVDAVAFLLLALSTFFVDLGTAGFNSYFDFRRGVDTVHTDVERYKVLVHRGLDPRLALWISGGAFAVAAAFGLALAAHVGPEVLAVGSISMVVAFFYSAGPRPISSTPAGELFAGGFLGLVLLALATYVQTHEVAATTLLLGLPSSVCIACILTVNNTCDIEGDRRAGRRTLSIALGPARAARLVELEVAATWALAAALVPAGVLSPAGLAPLAVGAAVSALAVRRLGRRGYTHATKPAAMLDVSGIFLTFTVAMLAALALRGW